MTIYAYQKRIWTVGSVAYSFGVGIKMSLLLAAPAIGIVLLQALPLRRALNAAFLMGQVQVRLQVENRELGADHESSSSLLRSRFYKSTQSVIYREHSSLLGSSSSHGRSIGGSLGRRFFYRVTLQRR